MSFFDRIFGRSPKPQSLKRSYESIYGQKRGVGVHGSHASETSAASGPLRSRARHAFVNNAYIRNGVEAFVAESVGAGVEPTHRTTSHVDRWNKWSRVADAESRTDMRGLVSQMVLAMFVDGDAFALLEDGPNGLKVRLIPSEMVDESVTWSREDGAYCVNGVEFNGDGTRAAYWVLPSLPTETFPTAREPIRIPAENVLHLFKPTGPGQVRGVSWLAPVLLTVNDHGQLQDALLIGQKISAMHAGFVTDLNDASASDPFDGEEWVDLVPGTVRRLPGGTDVKFSNPTEARDGVGFSKHILGQIAAGLGIPVHLLDGDLSNANYSSLRAGLLPFRRKVEQFQYHCLVPQVLDPLWDHVIGRQGVEWLMPRPLQVDPQKDTDALISQIEAGLVSRTQAVASFGWDAAKLDQEIADERARAESLGLTFGQQMTGGQDADD
jgi:lambda family phage portal protein